MCQCLCGGGSCGSTLNAVPVDKNKFYSIILLLKQNISSKDFHPCKKKKNTKFNLYSNLALSSIINLYKELQSVSVVIMHWEKSSK